MGVRDFSRQFTDPNSPHVRRRRAVYALPTLFTAGNALLGFVSIMKSFQGAMLAMTGYLGPNSHFEWAAVAIGWAVLLDGLDGRVARLTNTASDFGRELDSLADVITFGVAPSVLAFAWGVHFALDSAPAAFHDRLAVAGYLIPFLLLMCGAARLARFNIQKNPIPKNPGRPDRKYFVGLPIPASAALVAATVFQMDGSPVQAWLWMIAWLALLGVLGFLMVSTWRYQSYKNVELRRIQSQLAVIALIGAIYAFREPVLLALACAYVSSGVIIRIGGIVRRRLHHSPPEPERQVG